MNKIINYILSIGALLGLFFGVYQYMDSRYALAVELKAVEMRLDQKIADDQYQVIQQRLWALSDRYSDTSKMPDSVKEEMRSLQDEKDRLKMKLEQLSK